MDCSKEQKLCSTNFLQFTEIYQNEKIFTLCFNYIDKYSRSCITQKLVGKTFTSMKSNENFHFKILYDRIFVDYGMSCI